MDGVLPMLVGSTLTVLAYPLLRIGYRVAPYFRQVSPMIRPGGYVVVTGATDGIGYEFVRHLVEKGVKVIALGRNESKLEKVRENNAGVMTQRLDFGDTRGLDSQQFSEVVLGLLKGQKLLGIVNCVGTAHFSTYAETSDSQISTIHSVNINSLHCLLRLNQHLQRRQATEDRQFFINISSVTARQPLRYSLVYAASKAYLSNLISGLQQEQEQMVYLDVQPWFVRTKMIAYQQSWDSVGPEEIAKGALRVLGRRSVCSGCWKHELIDQLSFLWKDELKRRLEEKMQKAIRLRELQAQRKRRKE